MQISEILQKTSGKLAVTDAAVLATDIVRVAPLDLAVSGELSFLTNPAHLDKARTTAASAILVAEALPDLSVPQIVTANPYVAMAEMAALLNVSERECPPRSQLTHLHPQAEVDEQAVIYPYVFVDKDSSVGAGSIIYPHCYIGAGVTIGKNCTLFPHVTIFDNCAIGDNVVINASAVIGNDGFGFAQTGMEAVKIPHSGRIVIEDNCEIGALNTIARATFAETRIRAGCKLDAQVHIGHNVDLGKFSLIAAQSGIAGSTKVGRNLIMAAQTGIANSLTIPDHVVLGTRGGINKSLPASGQYAGAPALPGSLWRRQQAVYKNLPALAKKVQELERKLEQLKSSAAAAH